MEHEERDQLVAHYTDGYRVVAEALVTITPEELDATPGPGSTRHGGFGIDTWLRTYAPHAHRHADQIRIARGAGKNT